MATTAQTQETARTGLPPGPRRLPYLGNLLSLRQNPLDFFQRLHSTYGDMATIYLGKNPAVLLFRPEYVRYVLVEHPQNFSNRALVREENENAFASEGLLTIDGERHRQQRRAVQPAFHKKRVDSYAEIIQQHTQDLLKTWQPGQSVDFSRAMQELTLRIVSKCLFGIDLSAQLAPLGHAFDGVIGSSTSMAEDLLNIRIDNPITGYGRRMAAMRQLDMLVYTMIAQRRGDKSEQSDVLGMLMSAESGDETGTKLNEKQIHDHILTFLAAGHETTAIALTWSCYLLSQYPQVRSKLQAELSSVLNGRAPELDDLANLPYLDWVLSESMRLYPPAWLQMRFVAQESTIGNVVLPVGTIVILSQWVMHRAPEIWQDAEVFKPERWNPAQNQQLPSGAYFPFGGGPRMCIGMPLAQMEARLILASILQQYTPRPMPGYVPALQPAITLRPKDHLQVTLQPLSASNTDSEDQFARKNAWATQTGADRQGCLTALSRLFGLG
ncbi:MAG TPA: cytochrome P450 [Ktedonobacteraceae bacterium]